MSISPNSLAFIGLCNEYCRAVERVAETELVDFVKEMLRLLPRIYIAATDLDRDEDTEIPVDDIMSEEQYEGARRSMEALFGLDDTYLEVFEEDMKYSDTPIGASISEGLSDLLQVFYNIVETVRNAMTDTILDILSSARYDFDTYWSQKIVNVMRPLNQICYK
ncbi:MAG: DUF5063 domain-containing protein [Bacteroides sp.]|nr:DUF5063 domain-containing protein [Bacteroides sp.]MCM1413367.1 DUF5063 domain-containing protein [Bacteroides sp.]MCM1471947.1 DUF5063 domain-containing protein [Bacteroides sp.]